MKEKIIIGLIMKIIDVLTKLGIRLAEDLEKKSVKNIVLEKNIEQSEKDLADAKTKKERLAAMSKHFHI